MAERKVFPIAKCAGSMFIIDGELIIWGGYSQGFFGDKIGDILLPNPIDDDIAEAEACNLTSMEWRIVKTTGVYPLGKGTMSAVVGRHFYVFGGIDDDDYTEELYELNLEDLWWDEGYPQGDRPHPVAYGGMVVHKESLIVVGGIGKPLEVPDNEPGWEEIIDEGFGGVLTGVCNNFIYEYCTLTNTWRKLACTGTRPPPLARFSFDKIDSHHALLFGGKRQLSSTGYQDIYILDLDTMHWTGPIVPSEGQLWPSARGAHATACLVDPESEYAVGHQQIIMFWGEGQDGILADDIWLLHVASMTWKKVELSGLTPRKYHMCCSYFRQEGIVDVIVFGGYKTQKSKREMHVMTDMIIVRFGAVPRLSELCVEVIRDHMSNFDLSLIPPVLQKQLLADNNKDYKLFYYRELSRTMAN